MYDLKELRKETPYYIYDLQVIRKQIITILNAFSKYAKFNLYYSIKANNCKEILEEISKFNIGVSVSSMEEYNAANDVGFKNISYTAPMITPEVLELAKENKIKINLNNASELNNKLTNIGLRINPKIGWSYLKDHAAASEDSQFGVPLEEVSQLDLSKISRLHMHTSSDSYEIALFIRALKKILNIAKDYPNITEINIGGGIGTPIDEGVSEFNMELFASKIIQIIEQFNKTYARELILNFEPGSYIVRAAGNYVCKIISLDKKQGKLFYFTDGTKHHLHGLATIGKIQFITNSKQKKLAKLVGRTCQRSDILLEQELPILHRGDFVIIKYAGAYCEVAANQFHALKLPKNYFINLT
jgi:diaminopimelate decarboxylase